MVMPYFPATTDPKEEPNLLSQMMSDGLKRRRILGDHNQGESVTDKTTIPTSNIVVEDPSDETLIRY